MLKVQAMNNGCLDNIDNKAEKSYGSPDFRLYAQCIAEQVESSDQKKSSLDENRISWKDINGWTCQGGQNMNIDAITLGTRRDKSGSVNCRFKFYLFFTMINWPSL